MATESFFSAASLAYLASAGAGKDGKAYSIKPTDGTGDFTFSRGSNLAATRVNASGLIEKGRENLLLQSNSFLTTWTDSGANVSVTSGQSGYDDSTNAWLLDLDYTGGGDAYLRQEKSISGVNTFSIYAKSGSADGIYIEFAAGNFPNIKVDLTDGSLISTNGTIDTHIESISNGWYRVSLSLNQSLARVNIRSVNGSGTNTTGTIYIQDAQLEQGLAATDYIESGASTGKAGLLEDEPRFDYSGGATCPSLLLEPSRTQLIPQSEYFGAWSGSRVILDINTTETLSPEGLNNATGFIGTAVNDDHAIGISVTTSAGAVTYSAYLKAGDKTWARLWETVIDNVYVDFNLSGSGSMGTTQGTFLDRGIEPVGNGWYRCHMSVTSTGGGGTFRIYSLETDGDKSYLGDGSTIDLYTYGAQLEAGSYPTSYIPNHSGGSVTRGEDGFSGTQDLTGIFTDSSQGTIYFEIEDLGHRSSGAGAVFRYGSATDNLQMAIYVDNNGVKFYFYNKGAFLISDNTAVGSTYKFAIVFNGTSLTGFRNTTKYGPLTDDETFDVTRVTDMNFETNSVKLKQLLYFPEALSDADCIQLTTL